MKNQILFALFVVVALIGGSQFARAQDAPKAELFGGYSYLRVNPGGRVDGLGAHGFTTSLAGNLGRSLGFVAEFSRHSKSRSLNFSDLLDEPGLGAFRAKVRANTLLFGPRLTLRTGSLEPFTHALLGIADGRAEASGAGIAQRASGQAFTVALGGGLDLKVSKRLALRLGQVDYLRSRTSDLGLNSVRYATGLVIRMGTR
jgi:opacity protein-like surface antigen